MLYGSNRFGGLSRWHINCIYYLFQPVSLLLTLLLGSFGDVWIAAFVICFVAALPISLFGKKEPEDYNENND